MPFFAIDFHFGVSDRGKAFVISNYGSNIRYQGEGHNRWSLIVEAPDQQTVDNVKANLLANLIQIRSLGDTYQSSDI